MSFPASSLPVPTLSTYQMSFRGLTFSGLDPTTAYRLQTFSGMDLPPYVTGDVQRALDQGEFGGLDTSAGRDITLQQVVKGDATSLDHARQAMAAVMTVSAQEEPLYLKLPSGLFAAMVRPRRHNFPLDQNMVQAGGGPVTSQWHATDPRWYAIPTHAVMVGLPAKPGGLVFPIKFNVSFGGGGIGGFVSVTNAGLMEMRPVFVITGPCENPSIGNQSINGTPTIYFNVTLQAGDTLTVDTDIQSVLLTAAGTSTAVSRRDLVAVGSTWFNFPPGLNRVVFRSADGSAVAGTLTVQSADAYLGL